MTPAQKARLQQLKTLAGQRAYNFADALNDRDDLRDQLRRPAPRWWTDLEQRGDIHPWADRVAAWRTRLAELDRVIAAHEVALTQLDTDLKAVLALIAADEAREAHEDAVALRGRKNGYARRLRMNVKPIQATLL